MKSAGLMLTVFAALSLSAAPVVESVTYAQRQDGMVVVTYKLKGEAGIPLLDICTNGVSIGWRNLRFAAGDVHQVVQAGSDVRTVFWNPRKAFPGHSLTSGVTAVVRVWPVDNPPDVLVVNCEKSYSGLNSAVQYFAAYEQLPEGTVNCEAYKTDKKMAFRKIPAQGIVWRMGTDSSEKGYNAVETPKHKVMLRSNYYIGVFEVTQAQYERFYGSNPSTFKTDGAMRPVDGAAWSNIRGSSAVWPGASRSAAYESVGSTSFLGKLREHAPGLEFDLPTEAQWEFADRAGCGASFPDGSNLATGSESSWPYLETHARYGNNHGGSAGDSTDKSNTLSTNVASAAVGTYLPNRWGLYDMQGNMLEWVLDHCDQYAPTEEVTVDPVGCSDAAAANKNSRITRGGSYLLKPSYARCGARYTAGESGDSSRHFGFRLCIPLDWNK